MKSVVRIVVVALLLAVIIAGGYWLFQNNKPAQATAQIDNFTQTVAAERGDLKASISVVGEMYAPQNATLQFDRMGDTAQLQSLAVAAGNTVEPGQTLATIDPTPYQQALDQARSDLQAAEKKLTDLQTPATDLEIAQADLAVAQAELKLQQTQSALDDLFAPDIASLQIKVTDAKLALAEAQQALVELQTDTTTDDKLQDLKETEADRSADYTRLVNEKYSDEFYQDRLRTAYNKLLDAQDARITAEVQRQNDLLKAQVQVTSAEQTLTDAQEALSDAQSGDSESEIASAKLAVAQAETDLADTKDRRSDLDTGVDAVDLATARADVDKKRLAVSEAETDLAETTLTAPFAGTVLQTYVEPGDLIDSNTEVMAIANLTQPEVVASVDETTIRQVLEGQAAQITFDAFPGQTFSGEVLSVPLQGTLQGDVMVYDVPISLQGADQLPLKVGMTANVAIEVGQVQDALLVPTMALQNVGGFYQVQVADSRNPEAEPQSVPVEVGLSNGIYTQIVRGLNEGDQVVVQIQGNQSNTDFRALRQLAGGGGGPPPGDRD
ncbi:MAG: efflux RND transporter periplasmic adaptor subunit [Caldilineales bacterium]|nr:efflux RND transporter periplasmic adaptor subunit [Caldilineales bacterium]